MAAFRGMHVSPAKHSYAWLPRRCDYQTDRRTDRQTPDKVIPKCRYASQATQKGTEKKIHKLNYKHTVQSLTFYAQCMYKDSLTIIITTSTLILLNWIRIDTASTVLEIHVVLISQNVTVSLDLCCLQHLFFSNVEPDEFDETLMPR